jgi:hypothetical protein
MVQIKERIRRGQAPAVLLGVTPIEIKVLAVALRCVDEEVSIPNSHESYDYVLKKFAAPDRKLVSLALSLEPTNGASWSTANQQPTLTSPLASR